MPPLNILYQDEHLVAVRKPSGLLVHRPPWRGEKPNFCSSAYATSWASGSTRCTGWTGLPPA